MCGVLVEIGEHGLPDIESISLFECYFMENGLLKLFAEYNALFSTTIHHKNGSSL